MYKGKRVGYLLFGNNYVTETSVNTDSDMSVTENQVEVFFFPDESQPILQMCGSPEKYHKVEFGVEIEDLNDEFCILGEEAGTGIMPRHGVPEVRWLCQESLRIIDNHFAIPLGKTDLLKAPRHFPPPVLRYTLCEMSLIWHMYGGKDFEVSQSSTKKQVIVNDNVIRPNTAPRDRYVSQSSNVYANDI